MNTDAEAYRFSARCANDWIDIGLLDIRLPDTYTPRRYCPVCYAEYGAECAGIPEQPSEQLRLRLAPYQQMPSRDCLRQMARAVDEGDDVLVTRLQHDWDRFSALPPSDYSSVADEIRSSLGLSPHRLILPRTTVGPPEAYVGEDLGVDIAACAPYLACPVLTERAADALSASNLGGFELHPINPPGCGLYTLTVTGRGGLPRMVPGGAEWRQCEGCGQWQLRGDQTARTLGLDEHEWDGSDFFHFADKGDVFVSRNATGWFRTSRLRLLLTLTPVHEVSLVPDILISTPDGV